MTDFSGLFELQLMMFFLMAVGYVLRKKGIITRDGRRLLTDLVINVILPCNIITSYNVEFNGEMLAAGFQILIVSVLLQMLCTLISATCYNKVPKRQKMVLQYGTVCSNAGFLGNPVAEGLYGATGLLYASIYLIPQRIVMWSAGVSYFTESPDKKEVFKKVITHPCIIAVGIGLVLMVTQIPLPGFLNRGIKSMGSCTTALTMLFIGTVLADAGLKNMISRITVVYSVIRLVAIPLAVLIGCVLCHVEATAAGVAVVLAAMPMGSTSTILAAQYGADEQFATQAVVFTTLLSMAILPVWCMVLNYFF